MTSNNDQMTPTPQTDAILADDTCELLWIRNLVTFARQLETELAVTRKFLADANRGAQVNAHINQSLAGQLNVARRDITELNDRLIDRQQTLMAQAVKLQAATRILTRCRDSAGRVEIGLYEDIQNFLHTQP